MNRVPYQDGVEGVKQSISAMVRQIRRDRGSMKVKGWAQNVLAAAGMDGRDRPRAKDQAQALLDALRQKARYWPDPAGIEFVGTTEAILCLDNHMCLTGGDCDDLTVAFCSAASSVGLDVCIFHQRFSSGGQEHVLAGVQDESGNWLYVDPTMKSSKVGERATGVSWEQRIDPFDAISFVGTAGSVAEEKPEIVTFGRVPATASESMQWYQGRWWAPHPSGTGWLVHHNGMWLTPEAATTLGPRGSAGVGRVVYGDFVKAELMRVHALWLSIRSDVDACGTLDDPTVRAFYLQFNTWTLFYEANPDPGFPDLGLGSLLDQVEASEKLAYEWQKKIKSLSCKVSAPMIEPIPERDRPLFQPLLTPATASTLETVAIAGAVIVGGVALIYGITQIAGVVSAGRGLLPSRREQQIDARKRMDARRAAKR